jgi:hypothetical protein
MEDWERKHAEMKVRLEQAKGQKEQELHTAWAEDAQVAWDEGRDFYQPIIPAHVVGEIRTKMRRGAEAEQALHAITAVGWRLHTWAVSGGGALPNEHGFGMFAHPLFVRRPPQL